MLHEFFFDPFRIGGGLIHFIDGDDNRNPGGFGVVNGFNRLRHDAVIGSNHQDNNIRYRSPASAHRRKGRVPRSIDKGDFLAVDFFLISTDFLRDASGFGVDDMGGTNRVD